MVQEILMWVCVVGAFIYTLFSFGKVIFYSFQKKQSTCIQGCGCCTAKNDLLKTIDFKKIKLSRDL